MEHGQSLVIPPHFDGNNYAYWKVRMKAFLKSIDKRVWNSAEYGWEKPTTLVSEWQTSKKEAAAFNSKAMNAIFNVVSMKESVDSELTRGRVNKFYWWVAIRSRAWELVNLIV